MVLKSFRFFLFWQLFVFTDGSNEVARLPQQHVKYSKLSPSEWRRSHSSAGQWERRTLSKQKGPNWSLDSVPVITWPRASSSCKPKAARLRNNTPRVVALSRNEAWRSGGSATTRGLLFIRRVSDFYQYIIEISRAKVQILPDNGPILTLASSARWSGFTKKIMSRAREGPLVRAL